MSKKDTLDQVLASTWAMLERGASHSSDPFHEPKWIDGNAGREHFAAVVGRVAALDWLQLRPSGNIRARFQWDTDLLAASWIVP